MLPLRILLPYASAREFQLRYGSHLSKEGIFVSTSALQPLGTELNFELVLSNGDTFLRGLGLVERLEEGTSPPRGMYIRFQALDADSRKWVDTHAASDPSPPSDVIIGIDFGTEACRGAVLLQGQVQMLPSVESCVWLGEDNQLRVGVEAAYAFNRERAHGMWGPKRLLGMRVKSLEARKVAQRLACPLRTDSQWNVAVQFRTLRFSATQLAAAILFEFKTQAEKQLGRAVEHALLAVPCAFTDRQRSALLEAAALAGFNVLQLINETSALALAFGHGRGLPRKRVLVADWGADAFSTAVCELVGNDVEVISAGGQLLMGGMEVDWLLAQHLLKKLPRATEPTLDDPLAMTQRLYSAARLARHALAAEESIDVHLPYGEFGSKNESIQLRHHVTMNDLEHAASPVLERGIGVISGVLESARISPKSLDEVVLTGGQLKAQWARHRLESFLGRAAHSASPQDVSLGAALYAHSLIEHSVHTPELSLREGLTLPIGIQSPQGTLHRIFERNSRLPAERALSVALEAHTPLLLAVYQGTSPRAEDNTFLGHTHVGAPHTGLATIQLRVTPNGTIEVSARMDNQALPVLPLSRKEMPEGPRDFLVSSEALSTVPETGSSLLTTVRKWLAPNSSR